MLELNTTEVKNDMSLFSIKYSLSRFIIMNNVIGCKITIIYQITQIILKEKYNIHAKLYILESKTPTSL